MPTTAAEYRDAALERMGDANVLYRIGRSRLAMYAAGVAVECMLRAFRHADREHEAHHDVTRHLGVCERRLRRHLSEVMFYKRAKKASDTLKVACIELIDAALQIVTVGDERWRNP